MNLVGGAVTGGLAFVLTIIVTRRLGAAQSAGFFEAVAIFTILGVVGQAGSGPAIVRAIAASLADDRTSDVRRYLRSATVGVGGISAAFAACLYFASGNISHALDPGGTGELYSSLRGFAVFLPAACLSGVLLAATRGFGTMSPSVVLDGVAKPVLRVVALLAAFEVATGPTIAVGAWTLPIVVVLGGSILAVRSLVGALGRTSAGESVDSSRNIWRPFWRFSAFQVMADFFQVAVQWLDILILASLATARETGVYAAVGRLVSVGLLALVAAAQVLSPRIAALLSKGDKESAQAIYQSTTLWLCVVSFPFYLLTATFPDLFVGIFGNGFGSGSVALTILSFGMLMDVCTGPVLVVLLMGGRSGLGMVDAGIAGVANVALNFLLIPRFGIDGAAVAWAASIALINGLAVLQVRRMWGISPFGPDYTRTLVSAAALYGGVSLLAREMLGQEYIALSVACLIATPLYARALHKTEVGVTARRLVRASLACRR